MTVVSEEEDVKKRQYDDESKEESITQLEAIPTLATQRPPPSGLRSLFRPRSSRIKDAELDAIATQPSVYDDSEFAKHSMPHRK